MYNEAAGYFVCVRVFFFPGKYSAWLQIPRVNQFTAASVNFSEWMREGSERVWMEGSP
jgi:hypothetical protein